MTKNIAIISPGFLERLSKVYVTERLGIDLKHHQLTSDATWVRLAERLMNTPKPSARRHQGKTKRGTKR